MYKRPVWQVAAVSGAHFISHFIILTLPALFPLLKAEFPVGYARLGLLAGIFSVPSAIMQVPAGLLIDRFGARRVLIGGLFLTGLGLVLGALSHDYWSLLLAMVVMGIGQSAFHPADLALLEGAVSYDRRGRAFAAHALAGFLGFAAAPAAVGAAGMVLGWRWALAAAGLFACLYGLVVLAAVPDAAGVTAAGAGPAGAPPGRGVARDGGAQFASGLWAVLRHPAMQSLFATLFLVTMAADGLMIFIPTILREGSGASAAAANLLLSLQQLAAAAGVILGGFLSDRMDNRRLVKASLIGAALTSVGLALGPRLGIAAALLLCIGLLQGMIQPPRDRLISHHRPPEAVGTGLAVVYTGLALGSSLSSPLLGSLLDSYSPAVAIVLTAVLFMGSALMLRLPAAPSTVG